MVKLKYTRPQTKRTHLFNLRMKSKLRQEDVIQKLNEKFGIVITRGYYGQIERGEKDPSLALSKALATLFNSTIEEIL